MISIQTVLAVPVARRRRVEDLYTWNRTAFDGPETDLGDSVIRARTLDLTSSSRLQQVESVEKRGVITQRISIALSASSAKPARAPFDATGAVTAAGAATAVRPLQEKLRPSLPHLRTDSRLLHVFDTAENGSGKADRIIGSFILRLESSIRHATESCSGNKLVEALKLVLSKEKVLSLDPAHRRSELIGKDFVKVWRQRLVVDDLCIFLVDLERLCDEVGNVLSD